jgi:SAM-dependent methyltransferase
MNPSILPAMTRTHLDRLREHYEQRPGVTKPALAYREMLARYYNLLIPPTASVLEIGCGSGELLSLLNGRKKCDVDLSEAQVKQAREKIPDGEFYVQAAEDLRLAAG